MSPETSVAVICVSKLIYRFNVWILSTIFEASQQASKNINVTLTFWIFPNGKYGSVKSKVYPRYLSGGNSKGSAAVAGFGAPAGGSIAHEADCATRSKNNVSPVVEAMIAIDNVVSSFLSLCSPVLIPRNH